MFRKVMSIVVCAASATVCMAQSVDAVTGATRQVADTVRMSKVEKALSHLSLGGYGEAVMSRNFYSQPQFGIK